MEILPSQSAATLLRSSLSGPRFSSGCSALDSLFSHPPSRPGLPLHTILELMGPPGSGKTRTALGVVIATRFDAVQQGTDAEVLVVDAEASLSAQLIHATATLYAEHNSHPKSTVNRVCQGIHYKRIYDVTLLVAFFHSLPEWLKQHPSIKLIVIDSLTSHVRATMLEKFATREVVLQLIKFTLTKVTALALSVIVTTQLNLKLVSPHTGEKSKFTADAEALLVPPLGDSWFPNGGRVVRVVLYFDTRGERLAFQLAHRKDALSPPAVEFTMDSLGPCDYPSANFEEASSSDPSSTVFQPASSSPF